VRTLEDIPAGAFVCEYAGALLTNEQAQAQEIAYAQRVPDPGCYMYYFTWRKQQTLCVDATYDRGGDGYGRLLNHSRVHNNVQAQMVLDSRGVPHLVLYARRRIAAGEELFFDYGDRDESTRKLFPWLDE
jgi:SET domain-containing protein